MSSLKKRFILVDAKYTLGPNKTSLTKQVIFNAEEFQEK